jgi:hypothetical protein
VVKYSVGTTAADILHIMAEKILSRHDLHYMYSTKKEALDWKGSILIGCTINCKRMWWWHAVIGLDAKNGIMLLKTSPLSDPEELDPHDPAVMEKIEKKLEHMLTLRASWYDRSEFD